jgi:hypothetical protein
VPAFELDNGKYWICITENGGSYKAFDPSAEIENVRASDERSKGNTRALVRMLKTWQTECNVPIKSFHLELLAVNFLGQWEYYDKSTMYYDWTVRECFGYLKTKSWTTLYVPGTHESMILTDAWKSRAESAHDRATKACEFEADGMPYSAGAEWQKIFGTYIPIS